MAAIAWHDWDDAAFAKASADDRPILLVLIASWCRFCKELMETTFADAEVVHEVNGGFVAVRVDTDRRPDLNQRYNLGGWPTIAFLTPAGDLIGGDTFLTAGQLLPLLHRMRSFYRERRRDIEQSLRDIWAHKEQADARGSREVGQLSLAIVQDVTRSIREKFDGRYGGWGEGQKFPHPEVIDFAMVMMSRAADGDMRDGVRLSEIVEI